MLLFWERGYDAVAIKDLTEAMGIAPPSLYAAFTDKRTLFEEAVDEYGSRYGSYIHEAIDQEPTARQAVERLLSTAAEQLTLPSLPQGCLILNGASNYAPRSSDVAAALRARRADSQKQIERKIAADVEAGLLPADTNPHNLAAYVATTWKGMAQQARDGASRTDLRNVVATAMKAWPD